MNHYTPLSLSRKIASLGVECEIEHGDCAYCSCCGELHAIRNDNDEWCLCGDDYSHRFDDVKEWTKAYSLGELPPVLQAIGAVKGWRIQHHGRIAMHKCTRRCMPLWAEHFLIIARLYLDSKEKAWKYLSDLLDNN